MTDLEPLEAILGHRFADRSLLERALTHASLFDGRTGGADYERLEFLGDRVLGLCVAEMLYKAYPNEPEGALSRRLVALVRREALASVARAVGIGPFIRLSKGEDESGGRENDAILSDVAEALLGALYLDDGLGAPKAFIERHWTAMMDGTVAPPKDAKTALQELVQGRGQGLPEYTVVGRAGPDHQPEFTVAVAVEGEKPVQATGRNKREAEQAAAKLMLERLS